MQVWPPECNAALGGSLCQLRCPYGADDGRGGVGNNDAIYAECDFYSGSWIVFGLCAAAPEVVVPVANKTWVLLRPAYIDANAARAACIKRGGDLLTISSAEEIAILVRAIDKWYNWTSDLFIGLTVPSGMNESVAANWRWLTTNQSVKYSNWYNGTDWVAPTSGTDAWPHRQCGYALYDLGASYNGLWDNMPCNFRSYPRPMASACQLGEYQAQ